MLIELILIAIILPIINSNYIYKAHPNPATNLVKMFIPKQQCQGVNIITSTRIMICLQMGYKLLPKGPNVESSMHCVAGQEGL